VKVTKPLLKRSAPPAVSVDLQVFWSPDGLVITIVRGEAVPDLCGKDKRGALAVVWEVLTSIVIVVKMAPVVLISMSREGRMDEKVMLKPLTCSSSGVGDRTASFRTDLVSPRCSQLTTTTKCLKSRVPTISGLSPHST
jgi:hypothetical protein